MAPKLQQSLTSPSLQDTPSFEHSLKQTLFKMKPSLITLAVSLGLGAAAPQRDQAYIDAIQTDLGDIYKIRLKELEENNKINGASIQDIFKQFGWVVGGSLPGNVGKTFTVGSILEGGKYEMSQEAAHGWLTNIGAAIPAFLPVVGPTGSIGGFFMMLYSIAQVLERHKFAEVHALRQSRERCYGARDRGQQYYPDLVRTYRDLCDYCVPQDPLVILGKSHRCSGEAVVRRDAKRDRDVAVNFCTEAIFCQGYSQDMGPDQIVNKAHRYDPLRSFWCKQRDETTGMLMNNWLGDKLLASLDTFDSEEFRKKLQEPCKKLLEFEQKPADSKCPTADVLDKINAKFPPLSYCQPGKDLAKEPPRPSPGYEQDPENWNLFVDPETMMQYSKQGEFAVWTKKCGSYSTSSDGKLNHGCCGPFDAGPGSASYVKPEDGAGWCKGGRDDKVPEERRKIKFRYGKYEYDPFDKDLFVNPETKMQYRKNGEDAEWTGKCGLYSNSSDGQLNHGCCGPIHFDGGATATVKPEDGAGWCRDTSSARKVPDDLRKIKISSLEGL